MGRQESIRRSRLIELSLVAAVLLSVSIVAVTGAFVGRTLFEGRGYGYRAIYLAASISAVVISACALVLACGAHRLCSPKGDEAVFHGGDKVPLLALGMSAIVSSMSALVLIASLTVVAVVTSATGSTALLTLGVTGIALLVILIFFLLECAFDALALRSKHASACGGGSAGDAGVASDPRSPRNMLLAPHRNPRRSPTAGARGSAREVRIAGEAADEQPKALDF
jgi:hypothetical protein